MPKGHSYKNDEWWSYDKGDYSFLHDDFAHSKTFVVKAKLESETSGINLKQSFSEKAKEEGLSSSGEAKWWFNVGNGSSIFAKIESDGKVRTQIDFGLLKYK